MPVARMDHFTIVTKDAQVTAKFYGEMLGFAVGQRPAFKFPGVWLWNEGKPILHVIEQPEIPSGPSVIDHMAYWAHDLKSYVARLKAKNLPYELRRLPQGGFGEGIWQLFFHDPSGAKVELDFAPNEEAPDGA